MLVRRHLIIPALLIAAAMPVSLTASDPDPDYDLGVSLLDAEQYIDALKAFGRSAKNGNPEAQYQIGIMFLEGQGMKANPEDAAYWFRKAAQNGHAPSQFEIACCFLNGTGVQSDMRMAAEWFWRAAEQGDPDAALYVARMYRDGQGMPLDTAKARKYYKIAAEAGIPEAQAELDALPPAKSKPAPSRSKAPRQKRK